MHPEAFKRARALADKLMASGNPVEHEDELDCLTREEYCALDSIAFECTCCNLWFPAEQRHEVGSRWYCGDCA
jgi:hypothetical protein